MFSNDVCLLLVTCLSAVSHVAEAIRVDWGTNQGPIVPPTPRTTVRPQLPYREPAPVWEDQSNDLPNPNPYVYVLPPPSRPRTWPIPYAEYDNYNNNNKRNYGTLITQSTQSNRNTQVVAALAPKFIPNYGWKYIALVPKDHSNGIKDNSVYYRTDITDKYQGKYNAKTKKYKVYEKVKYAPSLNYQPSLFVEQTQFVPQYEENKGIAELQAQQFGAIEGTTPTTATPTPTPTPTTTTSSSISTTTTASTEATFPINPNPKSTAKSSKPNFIHTKDSTDKLKTTTKTTSDHHQHANSIFSTKQKTR